VNVFGPPLLVFFVLPEVSGPEAGTTHNDQEGLKDRFFSWLTSIVQNVRLMHPEAKLGLPEI
jgi:hypothetical protein